MSHFFSNHGTYITIYCRPKSEYTELEEHVGKLHLLYILCIMYVHVCTYYM